MSLGSSCADADTVGLLGRPDQRVAVVSAAAAFSVAAAALGAVTWAISDGPSPTVAAPPGARAIPRADVSAADVGAELLASVQQRLDSVFLLVDSGDRVAAGALLETLADDIDLVARLADRDSRSGSTALRDALAAFVRAHRAVRETLEALRLPGNGAATLTKALERATAAVTVVPPVSVPSPGGPTPGSRPSTPVVPSPVVPSPGTPVPSGPALPSVPGVPSRLPTAVPTAVPSVPGVTPSVPVPTLPVPTLSPRPLPTLLPL